MIKDRKHISLRKFYSLWGKVTGYAMSRYRTPITKNEKRLLSLKNVYQGRRGFIIGNGPSLNKVDLDLLKDEVTIGCNGIFMLFSRMNSLPTFYTVEDTLVAEDRAEVINKIRGTTKIFPYDLRYCLKPNGNTIFINFCRTYPGFPKFSTNGESLVYWGGTVTFMNIQLAYYLGIREVYLIGMDHDYKPPSPLDEQRGYVITSHSPDINHFHPEYFGPGFRYHDPMLERMEIAYKKAKEAYAHNGGAIYNATCGGKLEIFDRVDFTSLFCREQQARSVI